MPRYRISLRVWSATALALPFLLANCGKSSSTSGKQSEDCPVGSEGCACTTDAACNEGLTCVSSLCVSPFGDGDGDMPSGGGDGDASSGGGDGDASSGGLGGSAGGSASGGAGSSVGGSMGGGGGEGPGGGDCWSDPVSNEQMCACISVATWGAIGTYGPVPGIGEEDVISSWLNERSTARADYSLEKPTISPEYLSNYDVIIVQDVSGWAAFTAPEIAAFEAWIAAGGGVISLNGYSAYGQEMTNVNTLLASTGMSYVPNSDTFGNLSSDACAYCYGNSVPQGGFTNHPIASNIDNVGALHGRVVLPGSAEIVAEVDNEVLGAAKEVGGGRVFVFHDEWVTYESQWSGEGIVGSESCRLDPSNMCYQVGPANDYQSAQFWYNALKWASGDVACFGIDDPAIVR